MRPEGTFVCQAIFDAVATVNLVHTELADGAQTRTQFLQDGGSGGGSVFAKAPAPEPEQATPVCDSLHYEGQEDGADAVAVSEVGALLESGVINNMTLVFSQSEVGSSWSFLLLQSTPGKTLRVVIVSIACACCLCLLPTNQ